LKDDHYQHCLEWGSLIPALLVMGIIVLLAFSFFYFPRVNAEYMYLEIGFDETPLKCFYESGDGYNHCDYQNIGTYEVALYDHLRMYVIVYNYGWEEQCAELVFKDNKNTIGVQYVCVHPQSEYKVSFLYYGMPPANQFHNFEIDGGDYLNSSVYIWVTRE